VRVNPLAGEAIAEDEERELPCPYCSEQVTVVGGQMVRCWNCEQLLRP
jgi:hypothetical protein